MSESKPDYTQDPQAYCEAAIAGITERLKGPLSNLERQLLVADRRDFRETLAQILKDEQEDA